MRMVAMTGDTASAFLLSFQVFFIVQSSCFELSALAYAVKVTEPIELLVGIYLNMTV
jgi:hypothetical protein